MILKHFCLSILVSLSLAISVSGQKKSDANLAGDSIGRKVTISPFIEVQVQYAQFSDRMAFYGGAGLGMLVNDRWQLEADYSTIINQYIQRIIFPVNYHFKYWQVGMAFKYHVVRGKAIYGYLGARTALGKARWTSEENQDDSFNDNIFLLTPEIGAGFNLFPFLSTEIAVGYNTAFDVELIGLKEKAFDGIVMSLRLKVLKRND